MLVAIIGVNSNHCVKHLIIFPSSPGLNKCKLNAKNNPLSRLRGTKRKWIVFLKTRIASLFVHFFIFNNVIFLNVDNSETRLKTVYLKDNFSYKACIFFYV